ncbi:MAG TPA: type I-E CRISPR-associated protein Cse1/CasA [Thermomicrobiales bacterium]|jgi:CRISPR system Cascade subunit CasA
MPSFNLIDEPWIPCNLLEDNRCEDLSLRGVLAQSPAIREVYDPSPLVTVAVHRLLLALLHRNLGPRTIEEWCALWERGAWDMIALDEYLARWHHRFDLFDPEQPFYQVRFTDDTDAHDMAFLAPELVYGNSSTLFDHRVHQQAPDSARMTTPARAAHLLLVRQGYSIGFGKSQPFYFQDGPLTRGFTVLAQGNTLFETLMLNLIRYDNERPLPHVGTDLPRWEQDTPGVPDRQGTVPRGYLDYLTWQSRRIELLPAVDGKSVAGCKVRQDLRLIDGVLDPFKSYRRDEVRGMVPRNFRPQRAVWRDSSALFVDRDPFAGRPELFRWLARIGEAARQGRIHAQERYAFSLFGFTTEEGQAANIVLWRQDRLPLPLLYLEERTLWEELEGALDIAERSGRALLMTSETLAALVVFPDAEKEVDGLAKVKRDKATKKRITSLVAAWSPSRRYWSRLEPPFLRLLVSLPDDRARDEDGDWQYGTVTLQAWRDEIKRSAWRAFGETARGMDTSGRTLKAITRAERELRGRLRGIFGDVENGAIPEKDTTYGEVEA